MKKSKTIFDEKWPTYRIVRTKYNSADKSEKIICESFCTRDALRWVKENFKVSRHFEGVEYDAINILNHYGMVVHHFRIVKEILKTIKTD